MALTEYGGCLDFPMDMLDLEIESNLKGSGRHGSGSLKKICMISY